MSNEEKILQILESMDKRLEALEAGQAKLETGQAALEGRMERLGGDQKLSRLGFDRLERMQTALEGRMSHLEDGQSSLQEGISELKTGQAKLEADVSGIKVRLDVDIQKQIDQVIDVQDELYRKLTKVEDMAETTKDKVDAIHAAVVEHSQAIVELKQAK